MAHLKRQMVISVVLSIQILQDTYVYPTSFPIIVSNIIQVNFDYLDRVVKSLVGRVTEV